VEDLPVPETGNEAGTADYVTMAVDLVSSYVSNNSVSTSELCSLLTSVHASLSSLTAGQLAAPTKDSSKKPSAAQIKKSITPDALISFEDCKPYKTLKRHLRLHGLTPETYRNKYGLPDDYPMTCPSYSARRSELARSIGLGNNRKAAPKAASQDKIVSEVPAEPEKSVRSRKNS